MSNNTLENALKDFKRSVEITRDVRFQANIRLSKRQRASAYIVSLLSLYVIALSLIPNIMTLAPFQSQILLACSIVISVFVIFTSLIDGAQNFYHQGELLHQCARKIATINHALKNIDVENDHERASDELKDLQKAYQVALDECPINHDNMDFYKEIANKPHLFPSHYPHTWKVHIIAWNKTKYFFLSNMWMAIHLIAVVIVSVIVFEYVLISPVS
jgi:uncharacterized membrane protein YobD (UPF0266 family)